MTTHKKPAFSALLSVVLLFGVAACYGKPSPAATTQASASQNDAGDPADANNAPVNGPASAYDNGAASTATQPQAPSNPSYRSQPAAPQQYSQNEPPPPPPPGQAGYDQGGYDQTPYAQGYDDSEDQQQVYAPEPPPPMPEYEQPYCPGDNYIWTPGYWYWSPMGYYWVPGAWVLAPYLGALWTPGYWGFLGGRYLWYGGYWGPYVGFYGGINYGFGYFGIGYQGGYWNHGAFYYNRSITRVGGNMRHVYARQIRYNNRNRVSYNGGRGGLNVRPNPSQMNAARARRFGAIPAQRQLVHQAQGNRAQFAKTNRGRPAEAAYTRPLNGGRKAPAARPQDFRPASRARPAPGTRPTTGGRPGTATRPAPNANRPGAVQSNRPTQTRPVQQQNRTAQQNRRESRPTPQPRPETRPAPQARPESRPAPQRQQQSRPAPQRQQDNRGPN